MRSIPQEDLDGWGVSFYEALEAARQNLTELKHGFIGPESGEGVYLSASKDSYDASRLILTEIIRQFRLKGDPIAMIPNRETLVVAGSDDEDGLTAMISMVKDALTKPHPISGIALRLEGDEWTPWLPDPSHSQYAEFRQLRASNSRPGLRRAEGLVGQAPREERRGRVRGELRCIEGKDGAGIELRRLVPRRDDASSPGRPRGVHERRA